MIELTDHDEYADWVDLLSLVEAYEGPRVPEEERYRRIKLSVWRDRGARASLLDDARTHPGRFSPNVELY